MYLFENKVCTGRNGQRTRQGQSSVLDVSKHDDRPLCRGQRGACKWVTVPRRVWRMRARVGSRKPWGARHNADQRQGCNESDRKEECLRGNAGALMDLWKRSFEKDVENKFLEGVYVFFYINLVSRENRQHFLSLVLVSGLFTCRLVLYSADWQRLIYCRLLIKCYPVMLKIHRNWGLIYLNL